MKKVKKFIAAVAAALMMGTVVPATTTLAASTQSVQKVALTQTAVSQNSMTISWADEDTENSMYMVMIVSKRPYAPSYGSTHTYTKNVGSATSAEFTGLEANMPYDVVVYKTDKVKGTVNVIAQGILSTLA